MLKEIVRGQEKAKVVLIEDSLKVPGVPLVKAFISSLHRSVTKVHLVLFDGQPNHVTDGLSEQVRESLVIHNAACDPLGWHGNQTVTMETNFQNYLARHLMSGGSEDTFAVIFCGVSNLILHRSVSYVCQLLARLSREMSVEQIVALVHSKLHSTTSLDLLRHTSNTVLSLCPAQKPSFYGACSVIHKKLSGKVTKLQEQYRLSETFEMLESEEVKSIAELMASEGDNQPDPTANLTFNLTLTDKEKKDRSQVVLPYMKQTQEAAVSKSSGEGKIFYQPDEVDDFDEEDPDDDLDI